MYIEVDGDMMDCNPNRVKTNQEALRLIAELSNIKYAIDFDKHWNMTDDHRYWSKMNDIDRKAEIQMEDILRKLR